MQTNPQTPATVNPESAGRLTVLIVDDSKVIRLALSKILREEFEVLQAADGEQAWDILRENKNISAVFSDLSMPNLDGYGLLDRIRATDETYYTDLPFIVITGNDETAELLEKIRTKGGNDLITKPFKTDEIKTCISRYLKDEEEAVDNVQALAGSVHAVAEETHNTINDLQAEKILGLHDDKSQESPASPEISHVARDEVPEQPKMDEPAVAASRASESFLDFTLDIDFDMADEVPSDEEPELPVSSFEAAELNVDFESEQVTDEVHSEYNPEMEQEIPLDAFDFDEALASAQTDGMEFIDEIAEIDAPDTIENIPEISDSGPDESGAMQETVSTSKTGTRNTHTLALEEYDEGALSEEELAQRVRERDQIRQALEEIRMREGYYDDEEGNGLLSKITSPFTNILTRFFALFRRKK